MCNNFVGYQVTTAIGLADQIGGILQVDLEGPAGYQCEFWVNLGLDFTYISLATSKYVNVSTTSHFVACTLNATTTTLYISMQDGRITNSESLHNNSKEAESWTVWSSGNITELIQMASRCPLNVLSIG